MLKLPPLKSKCYLVCVYIYAWHICSYFPWKHFLLTCIMFSQIKKKKKPSRFSMTFHPSPWFWMILRLIWYTVGKLNMGAFRVWNGGRKLHFLEPSKLILHQRCYICSGTRVHAEISWIKELFPQNHFKIRSHSFLCYQALWEQGSLFIFI